MMGLLLNVQVCRAAPSWSVNYLGDLVLDTSASGLTVEEMSGVAYQGPSPVVGKHRFVTVQDNGDGLITFDAAFDLSGNLISAEAISLLTLNRDKDFEGIAFVGDSVYLSDEDGPGVSEFDRTSGNLLQEATIPSVFTDNVVDNRGFESLAYDPQGTRLWTANEEALSVDGGLATASAGTTVRLLELELGGGSPTAGSQFAYEVEPIHASFFADRSGLSELVAMPDGSLLALERSAAVGSPILLGRLYEVDFTEADDVSLAPFDEGLSGETYDPVGKELLWSGAAGGGSGQNLEGLTVGPRLPNGDFVLLGVVDSDSSNTIVSLQASPLSSLPMDPSTGDFDQDLDADGADFLAWQRGFGVGTLAGLSHGDGNHDGQVTAADLALWQAATAAPTALQTVPEPSSLALLLMALLWRKIEARGFWI